MYAAVSSPVTSGVALGVTGNQFETVSEMGTPISNGHQSFVVAVRSSLRTQGNSAGGPPAHVKRHDEWRFGMTTEGDSRRSSNPRRVRRVVAAIALAWCGPGCGDGSAGASGGGAGGASGLGGSIGGGAGGNAGTGGGSTSMKGTFTIDGMMRPFECNYETDRSTYIPVNGQSGQKRTSIKCSDFMQSANLIVSIEISPPPAVGDYPYPATDPGFKEGNQVEMASKAGPFAPTMVWNSGKGTFDTSSDLGPSRSSHHW
jgi:hypothetical protein